MRFEHLVARGIVGGAVEHLAVVCKGDGCGEVGDADGVVPRAVQRIDDPHVGGRRAPALARLLREYAEVGVLGAEPLQDQRLGLEVHVGDDIGAPLLAHVLVVVETVEKQRACLTEEGKGDIADLFAAAGTWNIRHEGTPRPRTGHAEREV